MNGNLQRVLCRLFGIDDDPGRPNTQARLVALARRDFRVDYVFQYSGLDLPWHYQLAAFWAGQVGVFSHETALALHDLSDALPGKVHLTVPSSWRRRRLRVPAGLVLHFAGVGAGDRASYSAVPVTAPLRTLRDCIEADVASDLVRQGIHQARRRGIVSAEDEARLLAELGRQGRTVAAR